MLRSHSVRPTSLVPPTPVRRRPGRQPHLLRFAPDHAWAWVADTALALEIGADVEEVGAIMLRAAVEYVADVAMLWVAPPSSEALAGDAAVPGVLRLAHARPDAWARLGPDARGTLAGHAVLDLPVSHPVARVLRGAPGRFLKLTDVGVGDGPRDAAVRADGEARAHAHALDGAAAVLLPVTWRGATLGALLLATTAGAARRIVPRDVHHARPLAAHVGAALTRAQAATAQRRAAAEQIMELAAMAHDFKDPLALVHTVLQAVAEEDAGPGMAPHLDSARVGVYLAAARRAIERLTAMVDDTVTRARARTGPAPVRASATAAATSDDRSPVRRPCATPSVTLAEVAATFAPTAARGRVTLDVSLAPALPGVLLSALTLHRVVGNLLGNALKFTPAGGRVLLRAERRDDMLVVQVTDTGPGIAPEARAAVFEPYWRGTHQVEGSGLGLSIVRTLVEEAGGRVHCEPGETGGSAFELVVPLAAAAAASRAEW